MSFKQELDKNNRASTASGVAAGNGSSDHHIKSSLYQLSTGKSGLPFVQSSLNGTPSSQSTSLKHTGTAADAKQNFKQGLLQSKKKINKTLKQQTQKQQALIATSSMHSSGMPPKMVTPGSAAPSSSSHPAGANQNFSCLIQKQLTSSNYGHLIEKPNSQVTRSLEKINSTVNHVGGSTRNHGQLLDHHQRTAQTTSSQHNSVSLQSIKKNGSGVQAQYRGSQPQQKQKIKAFKRQTDPSLAIGDPSKIVISQASASSSMISAKSVKRTSNNFVSLGGVQPKEDTSHAEQHQQANSSVKNSHPSSGGLQKIKGTSSNMISSKIGAFRADQISSRGGGGAKSVNARGGAHQKQDRSSHHMDHLATATNDGKKLSSSSVNSVVQQVPPQLENRRDQSRSSQQKTSSSKDKRTQSITNSTSKAAEASYCPKLNLNASQEIVLRHGGQPTKTPSAMHHQQYAQQINSTNQACLLPSHMIMANGPSSMQAQSKGQHFLPSHLNGNILLSASFEKLNMIAQQTATAKSGSNASQKTTGQGATITLSQSSQNTLRTHQQIKLKQHPQQNLQSYLQAANMGSNKPPGTAKPTSQRGGSSQQFPATNLKIKKSAGGGTIKPQKSFMTPQRLKKAKDSQTKATQQVTGPSNDASLLNLCPSAANKQQVTNKAHQYLRNSFVIKNQQLQTGSQASQGPTSTTGSLSPRSHNHNGGKTFKGVVNLSRNTTGMVAKTISGYAASPNLTAVSGGGTSNSMISCSNVRSSHSPINVLPKHTTTQQQQQYNQQKQLPPKGLNVLAKSKPVAQQLDQKLMIDKKTYEDLMSYLVKAEVNRLKHNTTKEQQPPLPQQEGQILSAPMNRSYSNSILHSSNQNKQGQKSSSSPKPSLQNSISKQKAGDFHSQQAAISPIINWQPQMTLTQSSLSNQLMKDIPISKTVMTSNNASVETKKQHGQNQGRFVVHSAKAGGSGIPVNSSQKNKLAVSNFMVAPTGSGNQVQSGSSKTQMLKTTISQNSQSREASLNSHKTNGQATTHQSKTTKLKQPLFYSSKQNLFTKQGGGSRNGSSKPQQLLIKGSKQVTSRNGQNVLTSGGVNSRTQQNQNQTVFTVSLKSSSRNNQFLGMPQPSPNQTVISSTSQIKGGGGKKANLAANTIPTKIIKARSVVRGAPHQPPNSKLGMAPQAELIPQNTLKNNFMGTTESDVAAGGDQQQPPKTTTNKRIGLTELQLKMLNYPSMTKDRVQSAKSSTTNGQSNSQQQRVSLNQNNGAKSHRESQRYFSRPQEQQQPANVPQKVTIKQQVDKVASRQKVSSANQSQGSKERKRSRQLAESHSKDSRRSNTRCSNSSARGRQRVNTAESSHDKRKSGKRNVTKVDSIAAKNSSLVGMLSLELMAGPSPDEFDSKEKSLGKTTDLIDTVVLTKDHLGKLKKKVKDSCDIEVEDAMEGMIGGNFNTFGEQVPNALVIKPKSLEDDVEYQNRGKLIKRIENQIERELKQSKDTTLSNHPMFEVTNQSSNSFQTYGSNTIDLLAKPPQNSLIETEVRQLQQPTTTQVQEEPLLDTTQSKDVEKVSNKRQQTKASQNSAGQKSLEQKQKNFHYSGSFGIPGSTLQTPSRDELAELEREAIAIDASQLYQVDSRVVENNTIPKQMTQESGSSHSTTKVLLATAAEEYSNIGDNPHKKQQQTMEAADKGAKNHFQLINMSFSQQENGARGVLSQTADGSSQQKNPHNTILTFEEYEDHMEGHSKAEENKNGSSSQGKVLIVDKDNKCGEEEAQVQEQVHQKIYTDADYRKQLLLRVLPQFEKLEQFDQLHNDFINSTDHDSDEQQDQAVTAAKQQMAVSQGAASLLRQINKSLGSSNNPSQPQPQPASHHEQLEEEKTLNTVEMSFDEGIETNTVVENDESDSDLHHCLYSGGGPSIIGHDIQSPSVASERQIKSFETGSLQSPQNSTRIELQTPSNQTSQLQSQQISQHTTSVNVNDETRLILMQSSEPESNRKQGGAFAVCSPRTAAKAAAIYDDGANGGRQAIVTSSVRHSKQMDGDPEMDINGQILPQFGVQTSSRDDEDQDENLSFQTLREDDDLAPSQGETEHVTSFYGPEKPQYDEMVSIMQGDTCLGEMIDENIISQIGKMNVTSLQDEDDNGGSQAAQTNSPHSINQSPKRWIAVKTKKPKVQQQQEEEDDEDQFSFVENLNKQYADAMEQRKIMKMMNKPKRQNSF